MVQLNQDVKENPITFYEIDYDAVEIFLQRIEKAYENEEQLLKALDQLTQILTFEFKQNETLDKALMVYRSVLILLISDKLSWDWRMLFESLMKTIKPVLQKFRKETKMFEEFLILNVSKARFTTMV